MKTIEITLAERDYTIQELPSRKNAKWRESLRAEFGVLFDTLSRAPQMQIDDTEQITTLVKIILDKVGGSVDLLRERLFDYAPQLKKDQEYLEENGYDSEFVDAFIKVLKLAYPFGGLVNLAQTAARKAGSSSNQTLPS
jgi:hypothetical protein